MKKKIKDVCRVCNTLKTLKSGGLCAVCYAKKRKKIVCKSCGETKPVWARMMCVNCYKKVFLNDPKAFLDEEEKRFLAETAAFLGDFTKKGPHDRPQISYDEWLIERYDDELTEEIKFFKITGKILWRDI